MNRREQELLVWLDSKDSPLAVAFSIRGPTVYHKIFLKQRSFWLPIMLPQPDKKSQWNTSNKPLENYFHHFSIHANLFPSDRLKAGQAELAEVQEWYLTHQCWDWKQRSCKSTVQLLAKKVSTLPFHTLPIHVPQGNMLFIWLFSSFHWQTGFKSKLLQTFTPLKCQMDFDIIDGESSSHQTFRSDSFAWCRDIILYC